MKRIFVTKKEEENKNIINEMNLLKKESEEGKNKIEENTKLKNNYYLLVNEFNNTSSATQRHLPMHSATWRPVSTWMSLSRRLSLTCD